MTKQEARSLLPKVGELRMETPNIKNKGILVDDPQECRVVEVNTAHLWYRVEFTASGFTECYKVPKTASLSWEVEK